MTSMPLPPGVRYHKGELIRVISVREDGEVRRVRRPVALTQDEARARQADFYHPELGWLRGGKKMEREHPLVEQAIRAAEDAFDDDDWDDFDDEAEPEFFGPPIDDGAPPERPKRSRPARQPKA